MFAGRHVEYPLLTSYFNETWIFSTYFEKFSKTKFHDDPSSGSRVFPCSRTERLTDGGRMDRPDEGDSLFSQFSAKRLKTGHLIIWRWNILHIFIIYKKNIDDWQNITMQLS